MNKNIDIIDYQVLVTNFPSGRMQNGSTKEFNVALCGGGVVGGGVCRILKEREQVFEGFGLNFHVKWILVRNVEKTSFEVPDGAKLTSDLQDILNDASIHLLVEVMGGLGCKDGGIRGLKGK